MSQSVRPTTDCRFCGGSYSPRGIGAHEQWCDENPDKGTPPDAQAETTGDTSESPDSLPSRQTLGEDENRTHSEMSPGDECPICGHLDVMDGDTARQQLRDESRGNLHEAAAIALSLSDWYCTNPDCGAVWTDPSEAVTMEKVMRA